MKKRLLILLNLFTWISISRNKSEESFDFEWSVSTPVAEGLDQQKIDQQ